MYCAIGVEPTNEIAATFGCSSRRSTATLSPCTTLNTPGGRPASANSCAQKFARRWIALARLQDERVAARDRERVHPHRHHRREVERRDAGDHAERLADRVRVDLGRDVPEYSPFARSAMPHANSITSRPRWTSPIASAVTLPCSSVSSFAMSAWCLSTSWRNANRIFVRLAIDAWRQLCAACHADRPPRRSAPASPSRLAPGRHRSPG